MDPIYNSIGKTYSATRVADPRIVDRLCDLLDLSVGSRILDVGAGTGNYSQTLAERGFYVTALEPSEVMRVQGKQHPHLKWVEGVAEALPFGQGVFDGIVMTLCVHHFHDWKMALAEASRVVGKGPIVILAFDALYESGFWLFDYFPEFQAKDREWFPPVQAISEYCTEELTCIFEAHRFPLPRDLKDLFAASAWSRPEMYLDPQFQAGVSSFAVTDEGGTRSGLQALETDLKTGDWERKYRKFRSLEHFDAGYRFFRIQAQR
ncbi:MAG: class I SAM-dependent methyltransferase [Opitutales bacterium]